jgi:hypothetical protein
MPLYEGAEMEEEQEGTPVRGRPVIPHSSPCGGLRGRRITVRLSLRAWAGLVAFRRSVGARSWSEAVNILLVRAASPRRASTVPRLR